MKCFHCSNDQIPDIPNLGKKTKSRATMSEFHTCEGCQTTYGWTSKGMLFQYFFQTIYKEKVYQVRFKIHPSPRFGLFTHDPHNTSKVICLTSFDYLPNINPTNINDKLPTLLTFL